MVMVPANIIYLPNLSIASLKVSKIGIVNHDIRITISDDTHICLLSLHTALF